MFDATGRGDDMGVITGLPTPKPIEYKQSMTLYVWINCAFVYL